MTRRERVRPPRAPSQLHGLDFERLGQEIGPAETMIDELERFFVNYNAASGREFVPLERMDASAAARLVERLGKAGKPA